MREAAQAREQGVRRSPMRWIALGVLAVGATALFLAEAALPRVAAAFLLLAGIVLGVLAIATPEFTAGDEDDAPR